MPAGSLVSSISANPGNSSFGMSLYLADLLPDQAFEFFLTFSFFGMDWSTRHPLRGFMDDANAIC